MRLLSLVAVLAVPAFAQTIYSWEDAAGVHYTDDLSQVPKKAKVDAVEAKRSASKAAAAPAAPATRVATAPAEKSNEYEWRDRFIAAHRRIDTVRKSLAALEATVPPRTECVPQPVLQPGGQPVPLFVNQPVGTVALVDPNRAYCQVNPLHDQLKVQIAQQAIELKNAELDLDQLDRRASMESVPREWRRGW